MTATVEKPKATKDGVLTFEEIKEIVGNGWAVIKNPEFNGCIFLRGELYFHSQDEDEAGEVWGKSKENHLYFKFCGERDPNIVYLL